MASMQAGTVHLIALRDDVVSEILDIGRYMAAEDVDLPETSDHRPISVMRALEVRPRMARLGALERAARNEPETQTFDLHDLPVTMAKVVGRDHIPSSRHVHVAERHQRAWPENIDDRRYC